MSQYKFAVQNVGRPYGPCGPIPDSAWREYSRHTTLPAAAEARNRASVDMRRRCGQDAWDDHYRVVALESTVIVFTEFCEKCGKKTELRVTWPAGETCPEPETTLVSVIDDRFPHYYCAVCAAAIRHVYDGDTNEELCGTPAHGLVAASLDAGDTGLVGAYYDGSRWQHTEESDAALVRIRGYELRTVYIR